MKETVITLNLQTSNTIAVINNVAFRVAYLPNKFTNEIDKVITNEK